MIFSIIIIKFIKMVKLKQHALTKKLLIYIIHAMKKQWIFWENLLQKNWSLWILNFNIIVTGKDYTFPIHRDHINKLLSGVVYLMPDKNAGTIIYDDKLK